jgi:hypothetical protein
LSISHAEDFGGLQARRPSVRLRSTLGWPRRPPGLEDEEAFAVPGDGLSERSDLRCAIGRANRENAAAENDGKRMIAHHAGLYSEAIVRADAFIAAE